MFFEIANVQFNPTTMTLTIYAPEFALAYMPTDITVQLSDSDFYVGSNGQKVSNLPSLVFMMRKVCDAMNFAWSRNIWVGASKPRFVKEVREYIRETLDNMLTIRVASKNYETAVAILTAAKLI